MESKVTKYSAAAVIIVAVTLILFGPSWTPGIGGVVLADVQKKVAEIDTFIIRGTKTYTHADKPDEIFDFEGIPGHFDLVKYVSEEHGLVEEGHSEGKLIYRITFNKPNRQALIVLPFLKKYGKIASTEGQTKLMNNLSPKGLLSMLLSSDYKKLGKSKRDGVEVEGFEFQEAAPFKELIPKMIFDIQNIKGKVWVGLEEELPIWVEGDLTIGKCLISMFNDLNLHEVNVLEKCNVELDEKIFDTDEIPEGYTEFTLTDILPLIPIEAKAGIAGLGIFPAGLIVWKRRKRKRTAAKRGQQE